MPSPRTIYLLTVLAVCQLISTSGKSAEAASEGVGAGATGFISVKPGPEDLIRLPGTPWIIVSSLRTPEGMPGELSVADVTRPEANAKRLTLVSNRASEIDSEADATCHEPPDASKFFPHGINVRRKSEGEFRLYVVNHGGREAIEIYDIDVHANDLSAIWRGCIQMPPNTWPNGVAPLPGKGIVVSSMYDPADRFIEKFAAGLPTGRVWSWRPDTGWKWASGKELSGANGVEASPDGRFLFVSEWSRRRLWRFPLNGRGDGRFIDVDFLPDNLRWSTDGQLLVAGQNARPEEVFGCTSKPASCPIRFTVAAINPGTMTEQKLIVEGDERFGGATAAIRVAQELWLGRFFGGTLARYRAP